MIEVRTSILNEAGVHARPAGMIVKESGKFKSDIQIESNGKRVNGKSIMGVMSLGMSKGKEIVIHIDGEDEEDAKTAIVSLFENGFGEL